MQRERAMEREREAILTLVLEIKTNCAKEVLAAKGLLTSRGVFERVVQLAAQDLKLSGKFNCTQTLQRIANANASPQPHWVAIITNAAQLCAPQRDVNEFLQATWNFLSQDVHGQAWHGPSVKLTPNIPPDAKCMILELCKNLGLDT